MTDLDEKNMTASLKNLVTAVSSHTGDSRYYVARLAEEILRDIQLDELRKPSSGDTKP